MSFKNHKKIKRRMLRVTKFNYLHLKIQWLGPHHLKGCTQSMWEWKAKILEFFWLLQMLMLTNSLIWSIWQEMAVQSNLMFGTKTKKCSTHGRRFKLTVAPKSIMLLLVDHRKICGFSSLVELLKVLQLLKLSIKLAQMKLNLKLKRFPLQLKMIVNRILPI